MATPTHALQHQALCGTEKAIVHVLRCPQCTFLTLAQKRLQQHIAEAHPGEPIFYTLHTCALCNAVTTEKHLMEEHRLLYHCGETEDTLPALAAGDAAASAGSQAAAAAAAAVSAAVSAAATSIAGSIETKIAMDSVLLGNLSSMLENGSAVSSQPVFPAEFLAAVSVPTAASISSLARQLPTGFGSVPSRHHGNHRRRCQRSLQQQQQQEARAAFLGDSGPAGVVCQSALPHHQHLNPQLQQHIQQQQQQQYSHHSPPNGAELLEDEAYLGEESAKPWLCRVCSSCFPHQSSLRRHMKLHDTNKRFKCDKCQKRFSYRCNLMLHYRTHTNERPFHCVTCGARFNQRVHLQNHIQNVHSGPGGVRPTVTHECDVCGAWFVQINALTRHQRLHHDGAPLGGGRVKRCGAGDSWAAAAADHPTGLLKREPNNGLEESQPDDRDDEHPEDPPQLEATGDVVEDGADATPSLTEDVAAASADDDTEASLH